MLVATASLDVLEEEEKQEQQRLKRGGGQGRVLGHTEDLHSGDQNQTK